MGQIKYVKIGGAWKPVSAEFVKIGGSWKPVTTNYAKVEGSWKPVPISSIQLWAGEQSSARLYSLDGDGDVMSGWPIYGGGITCPYDVACDDQGNSYWACSSGVYKVDPDGNIKWTYTGHGTAVRSIAVEPGASAGEVWVYSGDSNGVVKRLYSSGTTVSLSWTKTLYAGSVVYGIALDHSAGTVYAGIGYSVNDGELYGASSASGSFTRRYVASHHITSVAIDSAGKVYIGQEDGWLRQLSTAGYVYWSLDKGTQIYGLVIGHDGYGYYANGRVAKFTAASGANVWTGAVYAYGVAVDQFGHVYSIHGLYGTSDAVIRRYSSDGDEEWSWQPYVNSEWRGIAVMPGIASSGW